MDMLMYEIIVTLLVMILTVLLIVGVYMEQAIANVKQALIDLTAAINSLQPQTITAADVQSVADGINAATVALKNKFPSA